MAQSITVPLMRPLLPTAKRIGVYLERIETGRWYTNFGPLAQLFTERLCAHFAAPQGAVVLSANGTLGLATALMASRAPEGRLCAMPSWTFAATAHAARVAGLEPFFVDVDPDTWALAPDRVGKILAMAPGPVAAVVVVAPFGAPIDPAPWIRFRDAHGIPVVIDAAAGFDTARPSPLPTLVSLHATKIMGIGEGGFVLCDDLDLADDIRARTNFGFAGGRQAQAASLNAKMSEYQAAVGLAALELWPETRARHAALSASYAAALATLPGAVPLPGWGREWLAMTHDVALPAGHAGAVAAALRARGIDSRQWWEKGCHRMPAFQDCPRTRLPATEGLAECVLGLPYFIDMTAVQIARVAEALRSALVGLGPPLADVVPAPGRALAKQGSY